MNELYNNTLILLKKINFSLLIITTVIVFFSFLATKPKLEKAINDLDNLSNAFIIDSLNNKAKFDLNWIDKIVADTLSKRKLNIKKRYYYKDEDITYQINTSAYHISNVQEKFIKIAQESSLMNIKRVWDELYSMNSIEFIERVPGYIAEYNKDLEKFKYRKLEMVEEKDINGFFTPTPLMNFVKVSDNTWVDEYFKHYKDYSSIKEKLIQMTHKPNVGSAYYVFGSLNQSSDFSFDFQSPGTFDVAGDKWKDYDYSILEKAFMEKTFIPVHVKGVGFNPLFNLITETPEKFLWKQGNFQLNFKELNELTIGYQDLPLSKLKIILTKELERATESVNLFGLKIPYDLVKKFGVFALIIVQLYFLLYLNYLLKNVRVEHNKIEIPWLFLHDNKTSRIAFILTSVLYPFSVAGFLIVQNLISSNKELQYLISFILMTVELFIVYLLFKLIVKSWKKNKS